MFTIITVLQLPPKESLSSRVSLESLSQFNNYSVGDEKPFLVLVSQGIDAISKCKQGAVDFGALHQPQPSVFSYCPPLGPSQVDKGKFADNIFHSGIPSSTHFIQHYLENSVAARRCEISISGLCCPSFIANKQQIHNLIGGLSLELGHAGDDHALLWVISEFQVP